MADIAIFRINYKSDFILTLNSDAGWMTPFCIKFWTGAPSQAYFAGFDGTTYTHCTPVAGEPTKLVVQFDDHNLPIGNLKFQIAYHFTVADFPTSVEDEVINQSNVIIEVDDAPAQVMLDFNGETAPEIEFSLPAYANEAQRIANEEQRIAHEAIRIVNEESRIAAETTRQQNETQRINNEAQRIRNEEARIAEFAQIKADAIEATDAANSAAALANEKAQLAADKAALADEKAQLAADKADLAQSAATLATEKAQLATDKAALAQSAATLANDKAALAQQKAEYATAQGDYAKAQGDYAKAQAGVIPTDVTRTQTDATFVNSNHDPLFYLRQANSSLSGLLTAAGYTKLNDLPSAQEANAGLTYDVSVLHPTSGVSGGSTYASLSAALAVIPQDKRKGGMTVKYVQSSDNNSSQYVEYMYLNPTTSGFTNTANWQKINVEKEVVQLREEVNYFVCTNGASTVNKKVTTATGYSSLRNGGSLKVKFNYGNTAESPTLNINSTGAKPIIINGALASPTNAWEAGDTVLFFYDETYDSNNGAWCGFVQNVVNDLTSGGKNCSLSADMGKQLKGITDNIQFEINDSNANISIINGYADFDVLEGIFEIGNITISGNGWAYNNNKQRVRIKEGASLHLKPGDIVSLSSYTDAEFFYGYRKTDGTYVTGNYWMTSDLLVTVEGDYVLLLRDGNDTAQTSIDTLLSLLTITRPTIIRDIYAPMSGVPAFDKYIDFDTITGIVTIPAETIFLKQEIGALVDYKNNSQAVEVDTTTISTSAIYVFYDWSTGNYGIKRYSAKLSNTQLFIMGIRKKYNTYKPSITSPFPWSIDGKPYGIDVELKGSFVRSINHRGYMNVAPENTIPAFKLSRDKGFKYVETDVRFTSDGVPVLLHDASINRTARNADGTELSDIVNIADITYAESQAYDFGIWKDAVFTGTKIPKFKDFIIFCRNVGLHPYIELKVLDQTGAETLVGIVNDCGMLDNVTWVSSTASYLQLIKSIDASARLGYFASAQATTSDVETAAALKGTENEVVFIPRVEGATSTITAACKTSGLPCEVWGTNVSVSDVLGLDDYISAVMANEVNASYIMFNNAMN